MAVRWFSPMEFDPAQYGPEVSRILSLGDDGSASMPLVIAGCTSDEAKRLISKASAEALFPRSRAPEAALAGLWLYFGCFDESHSVSQDLPSVEGSYWHAILHRQEPDAGNAGYWFRRVGRHAIFPELRRDAAEILGEDPVFRLRSEWDPFAFVDFCEKAHRLPGSAQEQAARKIQLAEWQRLFDYCAAPGR